MKLIVDLHLHSHYSRATSHNMDLFSLYSWGKLKGINIIGSGDFTHPLWLAELKEKLEPAENGLFKLKKKFSDSLDRALPKSVRDSVLRFVLTVEISNIYKRGGKVRKVHNVVISSEFKSVDRLNARLSKIGNLKSDGRPILGLDSEELLKITLDSGPGNFFIPAHIWTPWFSMFGSKSGFDSVEEAFGESSKYIYAVETGLSSDPYMNWRVKDLDGLTLVSNSDAHSPKKLGREANVIDCEIDYDQIMDAIKSGDERFVGTIEFYPEEGKYHYDGHRTCNICMSPEEALKNNNICPKCGEPLVLGVMHRVNDLSDRSSGYKPKKHKSVEYIVPLDNIIAETLGIFSVNAKSVTGVYNELCALLGSEFSILRDVNLADIEKAGGVRLREAIENMRSGNLKIEPGYDGVFGVVKVFEGKNSSNQLTFDI